MDTWTRGGGGGRGRGNRGRGRGDYNNDRQNQYNDGGSSSNIASRLGPMPGGGNFAFNDQYSYNNSQQQSRGRGGYNDDGYRGGSGRGGNRGGGSRGGDYSNYQSSSGSDYQNNMDNQSYSPRGGRNQTFSSRGRGRGGGNYRGGKTQFTRDFVDEDINMQDIPDGAPVIMVSGYPQGSERDLLNFLHRKSKVEWEELNVQHQNGVTYITVDSPTSADALLRKNGFTFHGSTLSIAMADGSTNAISITSSRQPRNNQQQRGNRSNALAEFLQERWDPQNGFLNLDDLPPTSHSISVVIGRLLNEAQRIYGNAVVTMSFARNKLFSVQPINKLTELFPGLQNLSLQENDIREFRRLDQISNNKLPRLNELVLLGNPIQLETSPEIYTSEIARRFPSISQLDFQPLSTGTGALLGSPSPAGNNSSLPLPIKENFFDQDSSRQASQDLLSKFFPLFDSNRSALADLYDSQSTFSINVSTACYARNTWGQGQRMTMGNENISKRFSMFPPTIHDLSHAENFVTDAWQTSGSSTHPVLLYLTVHGSFREASGEVSFDRVFLIAPSSPGSRAQVAGWHYVILSDSMILRNFSPHQK